MKKINKEGYWTNGTTIVRAEIDSNQLCVSIASGIFVPVENDCFAKFDWTYICSLAPKVTQHQNFNQR